MQTLTFNNQQLLFVRVPMTAFGFFIDDFIGNKVGLHYKADYFGSKEIGRMKLLPNANFVILGTIEKEKGLVSIDIDYETMLFLTKRIGYECNEDEGFVDMMEYQGLPLQEGEKYVILKIKSQAAE